MYQLICQCLWFLANVLRIQLYIIIQGVLLSKVYHYPRSIIIQGLLVRTPKVHLVFFPILTFVCSRSENLGREQKTFLQFVGPLEIVEQCEGSKLAIIRH